MVGGGLLVVRLTRTGRGPAAPGFRVVGTRIETESGRPFVPLGITVYGLALADWATRERQDLAQIAAAAGYWHANTVRIQVAPPALDAGVPGYLAAVRSEVAAAERRGLAVILSAQYRRLDGASATVTAPDESTLTFWRRIARLYAADHRVWFDLFNEPTTDTPYRVWRDGGPGVVGMQTLVDAVRPIAPDNVIVAESIHDLDYFQGIGDNTLRGRNIVYAVHPYFDDSVGPAAVRPVSWWLHHWQTTWGMFARTHPLLIGEWGEYEDGRPECQPNAAALVPAFLSYVSSLHLGLIAWSLTPGVMTRGSNLDDPTVLDRAVAYRCTGTRLPDGQGAGAAIRQFFLDGGSLRS